MSINLFVASAGYGSRLRPVTDLYPKPLLPIAGQSLIDRMIDRVCIALDINEIGLNVHYKKEMFEQWNADKDYDLFEERELLGTGGALWNAQDFFSKHTSLLINGDVLTDFDWKGMLDYHQSSGNLVTLAVQDRVHERRVGASDDQQFICIDKEMKDPRATHWYGYACVALYEPGFSGYLPAGESHVVPYWEEALKAGERIGVYDIGKKSEWLDLGNVNAYAQGVFASLGSEQRFFAEPLSIPWDCRIDSYCVVEKAVSIGKDVRLSNVILLSGAKVADGSRLTNCVVGPHLNVPFELGEMPQFEAVKKIGNGGSDRIYRRSNEGVVLHYSVIDKTIERQQKITEMLVKSGVKVPKMLSHDPKERKVLLEDLGDDTFRLWAQGKSEDELLVGAKSCLDEVMKFQNTPAPVDDKPFDLDVLLWESSYFLERFIFRVAGLKKAYESNKAEIDRECLSLAEKVNDMNKVVMHRDFQSENVMIVKDQAYLIDFQGAHQGPSLYDAASFIGDPYMNYSVEMQKELKSYFFKKLLDVDKSQKNMHEDYDLCAIQRHMQALGAYGFLSTIKAKKSFEQYIPVALLMLNKDLEQQRDSYPALYTLSNQALEKLKIAKNPREK
ncbi:sugar phosphate nucleotidyltransferase [Lentisphaera profundi]|uniref:Sugar phosphate nucleotidyltransferase n=1 Tax=Lentisphaera profundi TaxID=1658616 RepID=A0ABY7VZ46_9BACT|nr:sugar phosphate nucleotidyltransferase [Lentisphaera profundi]WDE97989.1 sugar phosphate nucleotidyltransferase [Lentisphaera profundi]